MLEVVFEAVFVEGYVLQFEVVVFEVVEVPENAAGVERRSRIGDAEVHVAPRHLYVVEVGEGLAVERQHLCVEAPTLLFFLVEESVECLVAEVLLQVVDAVVVDGVELGDADAAGEEVARVGEEGLVFAHVGGYGAYAAVSVADEAVIAPRRAVGAECEALGARLSGPLAEEGFELFHLFSFKFQALSFKLLAQPASAHLQLTV